MECIKSISYDQSEIINNILQLHVPSHKIDCDPTYSKGIFYKNTGVQSPQYKYDIVPKQKKLYKPIVENYLYLFILLAKNRIVADWQVKNQKNARKHHSYFWIFEKSDKKNRIYIKIFLLSY